MDIPGIAGNVLFSAAVSTIKDLLVAAVKSEADLSEADLSEADLSEAYLRGANLCGANLSEAYLSEANLSEANLSEANLSEANLRGADLRGADLRGADLSGAYLCGADLIGANLRGANLRGASLRGASLSGADLCGANLSEAYGKEQKTISIRVFSGLYRYEVWSVLFEDGSRWIRMGCLWKSLESWKGIGIRKSNISEFPDDGSDTSEERVAAFEFAKAAVLRMKLIESVEVAE